MLYLFMNSPKLSFFDWILTLLHAERPKLYTVLAFRSAVGLNPIQEHFTHIQPSFEQIKVKTKVHKENPPDRQ